MRVRLTKRAQAQVDRAANWWDDNRSLAPEAFDEELSEAFSLLAVERTAQQQRCRVPSSLCSRRRLNALVRTLRSQVRRDKGVVKDFRAALVYVATLVPVVVAAVFAQLRVLDAINALPPAMRSPDWIGWPLNLLPALACGFALFFPVARWIVRRWRRPGLAAHAARAAPLYLIALALGAVICVNLNNGDFWLFTGQLVLWAAAAALGGALADLASTKAMRVPVSLFMRHRARRSTRR